MESAEIRKRILEHLAQAFPVPGAELTEETDLLEEWFVDSLGIVETVMFLERAFDIRIRRADINGVHFRTVGALARLVEQRLQE